MLKVSLTDGFENSVFMVLTFELMLLTDVLEVDGTGCGCLKILLACCAIIDLFLLTLAVTNSIGRLSSKISLPLIEKYD